MAELSLRDFNFLSTDTMSERPFPLRDVLSFLYFDLDEITC